MKAAYYEQLGTASDVLRVGEVDECEPGPGEVRVRVEWSGVNPSDVKTRSGLRSKAMPFPRVIPHNDGSGVIDAVGNGVDAGRVGERVWLLNATRGRPYGTAAELVCLPQQFAVSLPVCVSAEAGACLGVPALTALHAVLTGGGVAGKTVLVAGGAGSVGHYAVQFASQLGAARVIATVSTGDKGRLATGAGADDIVMYRNESLVPRVMELTAGRGIDRIIEVDVAANGRSDIEMLRDGGDCVAYGSGAATFELPFFPLISKNVVLRFFIVYDLTPDDRARAIATLARMLERDQLKHNVAARFSLDEIVDAHEAVEQGRFAGNVVVRVA